MRLLQVHTRKLEEFNGNAIPPYAILSHTWGKHEVTFRDVSKSYYKNRKFCMKLEGCCRQAAKDGFHYVWIDTCCIDKSSSAELSEGINSMFQWYKKSTVCYVYLADVSAEDDPFNTPSEFRNSRWFTRGWTLQEILAPTELVFFDRVWNEIEVDRISRSPSPSRIDRNINALQNQQYFNSPALLRLLSDITNIPKRALDTGDFSQFCAAARLAWAAHRETKRVEDRAYSLFGILEVNMPLIYGEGEKAFIRLQEEVIKSRDDDSLLAWGYRSIPGAHPGISRNGVLAQSPSEFSQCHSFQILESEETGPDVPLATSHSAMTNIGLQTSIPIRSIDTKNGIYIAILRCLVPGIYGSRSHLAVPLVRTKGGSENHFSRAPGSPPFLIHREKLVYIINHSRLLRVASRLPLLWKLLVAKPISTSIYLREGSPKTPATPTWSKSMKNDCETMSLHIDEITSAGYEIASFYPPWITRRPVNGNRMVLRLGSSNKSKFIIVFSRPREFSTGFLFFAICISAKARTIARVDHGSALEYLMEQGRGLEINMNHHGTHREELELSEEAADGHVRCVNRVSFQYMFGDVRIKCNVERAYTDIGDNEPEQEQSPGATPSVTCLEEIDQHSVRGTYR
ncbi:HET-domain-containing protein [Hypoxylon trugodes]|uniref:HET-domain-containing protein n=1 Tax=Hypoxylon trugodes TaxID=326681 RepID=UPI00219E17F0|nr:HET-domain-containing protein [Hypoxylon trugodes]KAI1389579.1 HET-domain-containing protein [Hypoxylon trugodes]